MGWILYDKVAGKYKGEDYPYTYGTPCECRAGEIVKNLKNASGITEEFLSKTFSNFETDGLDLNIKIMKDITIEYYKAFDRIENTRKNSIALLGAPGSGKTHLLMALSVNLMHKKQKTIKYFPYVEKFDELRNDLDNLENHLSIFKNADILFIDDLFKPTSKPTKDGQRIKTPSASEWELRQIYSIINYRYNHNKPIFISCEYSFHELIELKLDDALISRMFEMCADYNTYIKEDMKLNYRLRDVI